MSAARCLHRVPAPCLPRHSEALTAGSWHKAFRSRGLRAESGILAWTNAATVKPTDTDATRQFRRRDHGYVSSCRTGRKRTVSSTARQCASRWTVVEGLGLAGRTPESAVRSGNRTGSSGDQIRSEFAVTTGSVCSVI